MLRSIPAVMELTENSVCFFYFLLGQNFTNYFEEKLVLPSGTVALEETLSAIESVVGEAILIITAAHAKDEEARRYSEELLKKRISGN
jgi:hypothetical protein